MDNPLYLLDKLINKCESSFSQRWFFEVAKKSLENSSLFCKIEDTNHLGCNIEYYLFKKIYNLFKFFCD